MLCGLNAMGVQEILRTDSNTGNLGRFRGSSAGGPGWEEAMIRSVAVRQFRRGRVILPKHRLG